MRGVRAKGFYIFKESNKKAKEELHFVTFENLIIGADKWNFETGNKEFPEEKR